MNPETLIAAARTWLAAHDIPEINEAEPQRLAIPVDGQEGNWRMTVLAAANPLVAVSQQHFPLCLPDSRRAEGAVLCDAISRKLPIGDFRLDEEDGSIMLQMVFPVFGRLAESELETVFAELICRPVLAFGKALFPLAQFATGALEREACVAAITNHREEEPELWPHRGVTPERN
jgi:hypothetical protein